jgi:predicted dehydrogenase
MTERKVKAAVIGVGLIGEQHAQTYHEYPRSELAYVMDLNGERAKTVGEALGCRYTSSFDELAASDVEVVSVATPDHLHFEPVMRMIEAGKHIVVEKPIFVPEQMAQNLAHILAPLQQSLAEAQELALLSSARSGVSDSP